MKKKLLIFITVFSIGFSSALGFSYIKREAEKSKTLTTTLELENPWGSPVDHETLQVTEFTYKGHKYIRFIRGSGGVGPICSGFVHDENCTCKIGI